MNTDSPQQIILIVDDNTTNLGVMTEYLEGSGFEIMTARDGEDGITKAQLGHPDLILLDVMMPGINGFETCHRLKADPETQDIPIIFMTALHNVEDKVKGFAVGGVDYVTKPLQEEEVLARVQTHLQLQAHRKQLEQQSVELKRAKELAETAQRMAEKANQAKSIFLANMSHELRTPLNAILGFAQIMAHDPHTPEERENLAIIQRNGEHLLTLINQVLDISKIEAGRVTLNEKNFDLFLLLDGLKDMFRLRAKDKGLQLVFERTDNIPRYVRTDEVKLREVLINLLNNAMKFTEEGKISLRVYEANELKTKKLSGSTIHKILCFEIEDTGAGIAPEEMDKLFEAFAQTETGRQAQEGTGLGLTISRKFVQLMGGDITVKSKIGHGTTFTFEIQVGLVDQSTFVNQQSSIVNRAVALEPGQPRYRFLIADDKPDNRRVLVKLLNPFGFESREAANGQEAFEIWNEWEPHLIWMDMRMPVMDGYEATKRIKNEELRMKNEGRGRKTIIIAVTASSFEEEQAVVMSAGCDDFLRKPFTEAEIFEILCKHLGVRFIYEEGEGQRVKGERQNGEDGLTPDALTALPAEWLAQLKHGAEVIDVELLFSVIEQIRERDAALADVLTRLVEDFQYDEIWALMQGT